MRKETTMDNMTIELPSWARIGQMVYVKDVNCIRGDNPNNWFKERIISFGYDGVFHQAAYCPVYYTHFKDYGKKILLEDDYNKLKKGRKK